MNFNNQTSFNTTESLTNMTKTVTKAATKAATEAVGRHKPEDMSGVATAGMIGLGIGVIFLACAVGAVVWATLDDRRRARDAAAARPDIPLKDIEPDAPAEPEAPADNAPQQGQLEQMI